MTGSQRQSHHGGRLAALIGFMLLAGGSLPVNAQENVAAADPDYLEELKKCQVLSDDIQRLDCFDSAVNAIVVANDAGDVQVIDRADVRETRRSLFGFALPDIKLFGGDAGEEEDDELFRTTITNVRYFSAKKAQFTTAEGAVWEMRNIPRRLRDIEPGHEVEFKPASFGYFFVRINGQMGVKGRRIQ